MESCSSGKEALRIYERTGLSTHWVSTGSESNDQHQSTELQVLKYLPCKVSPTLAFSNLIFYVNACQLETM